MSELDKLYQYLKEHGYTYERIDDTRGSGKHQIVVYKDGERWWDVICHYGSYGYEQGLLEGYGELFIGAEGYLTADHVINRLKDL